MTSPGDAAYLGSLVGGLDFWGVIGDGQVPPMINGSFSLSGTDGNIDLTPIEGLQGPPGTPADIVRLQYEDNFLSPADLPENLTNTAIDIGKAWWIGNVVFVWTGTNFFQKQMGVPGPVGPAPQIECQSELVPSGLPTSLTLPVEVQQFGTPNNPVLLFEFDQDSITGPPGPTGPIVDAPDYDNETPPSDGDSIVWNALLQMFQPSSFDLLSLPIYSVPESVFESVQNKGGGSQQVCQYAVPPQPFNWIPLVFGNVASVAPTSGGGFSGILGDLTSFFTDLHNTSRSSAVAGCQVLLGDPTQGQLVGYGFGNVSNYSFILPHFSSASSPGTAISPTSSTAVVPAYHLGNQGTLYLTMVNDGAKGGYWVENSNCQLIIVCVPVSDFMSPPTGQHRLAGRGNLTATAVIA